MAIYKIKAFARFAAHERIEDSSLPVAIQRAADRLVDADLTGGLIKQRVARRGQGRRGGHRVLIAFQPRDFSVFLYGFSKNDRENLDGKELEILRKLASHWLGASPKLIEQALEEGKLMEVRQ